MQAKIKKTESLAWHLIGDGHREGALRLDADYGIFSFTSKTYRVNLHTGESCGEWSTVKGHGKRDTVYFSKIILVAEAKSGHGSKKRDFRLNIGTAVKIVA